MNPTLSFPHQEWQEDRSLLGVGICHFPLHCFDDKSVNPRAPVRISKSPMQCRSSWSHRNSSYGLVGRCQWGFFSDLAVPTRECSAFRRVPSSISPSCHLSIMMSKIGTCLRSRCCCLHQDTRLSPWYVDKVELQCPALSAELDHSMLIVLGSASIVLRELLIRPSQDFKIVGLIWLLVT